MKSLSKYPVLFPAAFIAQQFFSISGSLILGEQIVHIDEFEDQLALSNNKPKSQLNPVPLFFSTIQLSRFTFLFFIFLSPRKPPPQPPQPHLYCFPESSSTTTTFLLFSPFLHHHHCRHQISIVFPPSPPHFYCFPYSTTTMHILVLMFIAFTCTVY